APGAAESRPFAAGASGLHPGADRGGRRGADRGGRRAHRSENGRAQRALLRLPFRTVELVSRRGLPPQECGATEAPGGIHRRAEARHRRGESLASPALHLRASLEKPAGARRDPRELSLERPDRREAILERALLRLAQLRVPLHDEVAVSRRLVAGAQVDDVGLAVAAIAEPCGAVGERRERRFENDLRDAAAVATGDPMLRRQPPVEARSHAHAAAEIAILVADPLP